jgi:hypothetical protein
MFIYQQQHLENLSTLSVNEKLVPNGLTKDSYCLVVISVAVLPQSLLLFHWCQQQ